MTSRETVSLLTRKALGSKEAECELWDVDLHDGCERRAQSSYARLLSI